MSLGDSPQQALALCCGPFRSEKLFFTQALESFWGASSVFDLNQWKRKNILLWRFSEGRVHNRKLDQERLGSGHRTGRSLTSEMERGVLSCLDFIFLILQSHVLISFLLPFPTVSPKYFHGRLWGLCTKELVSPADNKIYEAKHTSVNINTLRMSLFLNGQVAVNIPSQ